MPCISQYFGKSKQIANNQSDDILEACPTTESISDTDESCSVNFLDIGQISATTMSSLNAEIWSLRSNLSENEIVAESMQAVVKALVEDKYTLIEELCDIKNIHEDICQQYADARENHILERKELINEVHCLKSALDENVNLLEKTVKQNIELKLKLQDAYEKINSMGSLYLKLCGTTENPCNDTENK